MARVCPHCATANGDTGRFCASCGARLDVVPTAGLTHRPATPTPASAGVEMALSLGQGRYEVERRYGVGGMSTVYRARDTHFSNRIVAVKEMIDTFADAAERAEAEAYFHQEADMLTSLRHPAIPQVFDRFSENSRHYLVMEFISGQTLEDMIEQHGGAPFSEAEVRPWINQICAVLSYLHDHTPPVIFRDLKPGNIMIEAPNHVRLIDFGIARVFKAAKSTDTTALGTTGYASPEHYTGQTDARSDIYSLGATLHHLLTGRDPTKQPPFTFPAIPTLAPSVSAEMANLITRCLNDDRTQRPQTITEVEALLRGQATAGTTMLAGSLPMGTFAVSRGTRTQTLVLESVPASINQADLAQRVANATGQPLSTTRVKVQQLPAVLPITQTNQIYNELPSLIAQGARAWTAEGMTDLVDLSEPLRRRLMTHHQVVIWDAVVGAQRTCVCRRCGNRWQTNKPVGASVPLQCPACRSKDWSKRRLFKCRWCGHEFENNDFWSPPETIAALCPSCHLTGWWGDQATLPAPTPLRPLPAPIPPQVISPTTTSPARQWLDYATASPAHVIVSVAALAVTGIVLVSLLSGHLITMGFPWFIFLMIWWSSGGRRGRRRP